MSILFVEHLTVVDCAYLDVQRGLVGESWIVDVELEGALDPQSMVLDFGEVKRRLKRTLDASIDHTLVVPFQAPELRIVHRGDLTQLLFRADDDPIEHVSPTCAVSVIDAGEVTPATVAAHLVPLLMRETPGNVEQLRLRLRPERIDGPYYHYVHGLKKHAGQCQRIAHGHRSRIEIRVDGERDKSLENALALRWTDIYLGTREDLVASGNGRVRFAYDAPEGRFELALPEARCDLLDGDSTVERIAEHVAARVAGQRPGCAIEVRAYEGVMKGAIARV
jgi:6-pyruvoyl-tetrahydropterin synthase